MTRYIEKETFGSTELVNELRRVMALENRIGGDGAVTIEFCGVVTNICVISNVVLAKAALPNARIIVNSDLCASNDLDMQEAALKIMKNLHVEVV